MLILDREKQTWEDSTFRSLPDLLRGDELIVVNNARVIPARLFGRREGVRSEKPGRNRRTAREFLSSQIEVLLTRQIAPRRMGSFGPARAEDSRGRARRIRRRRTFRRSGQPRRVWAAANPPDGKGRRHASDRTPRPRSVASLHFARGRTGGPRALPDDFCRSSGSRGRSDSRPAFFSRDSRKAAAARHRNGRHHAGRRPRHIPAHPRRGDRAAQDSFRALRNSRSRGRRDLQSAPRRPADPRRGDDRGARARGCRGKVRRAAWRKVGPGENLLSSPAPRKRAFSSSPATRFAWSINC